MVCARVYLVDPSPGELSQRHQVYRRQPFRLEATWLSDGAFLLFLIALSYAPQIILLYAISTMIEIVIERWTNAKGETDFRWSVWDEGHRIQMGENVHSHADDCEAQAVEFCWHKLGHKPDKVTRL